MTYEAALSLAVLRDAGVLRQPEIAPVNPALSPLALLPVAWLPPSPAPAAEAPQIAPRDPALERIERLRRKVHFKPSTPEECLPRQLVSVLHDVAERFGEVRITSTHRLPRHNARVGGARFSRHLDCRAIDFLASGNVRAVVDFLRAHPDVGGYRRYPGGHHHIDDGPKRTW